MIVLTGDHGESLGEHGEKTHGFFLYNATLHVPVIIHLPGNDTAKVLPELISLTDLMPTALQALKADIPAHVQGRGLLPLMTPRKDEDSRSLYAATFLPRIPFNCSELRPVAPATYQ